MKTLVITSISQSTTDLMANSFEVAKRNDCRVIVVGDRKSGDLLVQDGMFISAENQLKLDYELTEKLPWNAYSRKNIGYLEAIKNGSEWIIETDDDNLPTNEFFDFNNHLELEVRLATNVGWFNIYKYFGNDVVWPRGFPLEKIRDQQNMKLPSTTLKIDDVAVIQSIADQDPDVDAIFRLTQNLPQTFSHDLPIALRAGSVCPFNSQATWWNVRYAVLMYFPSKISWRAADIWRSFIATRIIQHVDSTVVFTGPKVTQVRNPHDLLVDFKEEISCYLDASRIWESLSRIDFEKCGDDLSHLLKYAYKILISEGFIPSEELDILDAWIRDLQKLRSSS